MLLRVVLGLACLAVPAGVTVTRWSTLVTGYPADVKSWAVGGHSLGGVAAARAVGDPRIDGVFLWASYPANDLSGATVATTSIYGEHDGLSTPAAVDATRALLPPSTVFVEVPGAVPAFFGDYRPQAGDGVPTVDRATAQRQIVDVTARFVAGL